MFYRNIPNYNHGPNPKDIVISKKSHPAYNQNLFCGCKNKHKTDFSYDEVLQTHTIKMNYWHQLVKL